MRVDEPARRCRRAGIAVLGVVVGITTLPAAADEASVALPREFLEYLAEWDDADVLMLASPLFEAAVAAPPSTDRAAEPAHLPGGVSASD